MSTQAPKYKWATPHAWLHSKISSGDWDAQELAREVLSLAECLDSDALQDQYQKLMSDDGYFDPIEEENA